MEKKSQRNRLFARARKKHQNPNGDTDENSIENQGTDKNMASNQLKPNPKEALIIASDEESKLISCKVCGHEVKATKLIMHITRSTKGCKKGYGKEFDALIAKRDEDRKLYLKNYKNLNSDAVNRKQREYYKKKKGSAKNEKPLKPKEKSQVQECQKDDDHEANLDEDYTKCKGCKKKFKKGYIPDHVANSDTCTAAPSDEDWRKMYDERRAYLKEYKKTYYQMYHKKIKKRQSEYDQKNSDLLKRKRKKYYEDNADVILEKRKEHYKENAEAFKANYNPDERREKFQKQKEKICSGCGKTTCTTKDCKATKNDRIWMEVELRKFNRRKQKNANDYYNKCFERVKDKFDEPLSAENLEKFQLAKDSLKAINDLYDNFEETEIENIAGEFKDITMYWDLRKFEEEKEKYIHRKWGILFRKIESNFAQIADHMEDECFNSTTDETHEAKYPSYMLPSKYYMLPRRGPCNVKNPCEKCRKATQHDLELF